MSKKRYIDTKFWSDGFIVNLNPLDRYLFLYLLTNEHTDICGIYEMPWQVMARETGLDDDMLQKMFKRLKGKIFYVDGWVYIKNFAKNQADNESVKLGIERSLSNLPHKIKLEIDRLSQPGYSLGTASDIPNLTKPNLTKPIGMASNDTEEKISKLYYETIKALKLPTLNHTTLRTKIKAMVREADPDEIITYLKFMRDKFALTEWEFKPHVNNSLDIYTKRMSIINNIKLATQKQNKPGLIARIR